MAKSISKGSSFLSYLWSVLMLICISLLTIHLILSIPSSEENSEKLIEETFTDRK